MLSRRVATLFILLVPLLCLAQENAVYVGVAVMQNYAGRSVPGNVAQDRLIKAINQIKPDKKTHLKVQAVALNAASDEEALQEAAQKKCQYAVFTKLTELRSGNDPYQHQAGTIETNPDSQWSSRTGPGRDMDPEFRATVDYKLTNTAGMAISGAPFSTQGTGETETVSQIMGRIALQVVDQIKKGAAPMRE
jgi:hypothetical protein